MADIVSAGTRSRMMAGIRSKDTQPELLVRSHLHRAGLRFRLHDRGLPGTPDLVLPKYRVAIFVHGCFWHRHPGCSRAYMPKSNRAFWRRKFEANVMRDAGKVRALRKAGWRVLTVWECATTPGRLTRLVARIRAA